MVSKKVNICRSMIDGSEKTYRTVALSNSGLGIRGFPSSSKTGPMSNTDNTEATTRYTVRRANCLPRQILPGFTGSIIHDRERCERYDLPPSSTENPILRIKHRGVDFPVLEESVWVEGFRVGIDALITTNRPDVLNHNGSCGDEASSINIVLHGPVWEGDRKRWVPSENFLYQSIDVR